MNKFWIDYSTSVLVEAPTKEEALERFWENEIEYFLAHGLIEVNGLEQEKN